MATSHSPPSPSSPDSSYPTSSAPHRDRDLKAPKDRTCPFCGQAFTSSSLGRHLDLYIKPRNPKPPDGVHDVEEIRKMRGGITRRVARGGAGSKGEKARENGSKGSSQDLDHGSKDERRVTEGLGKEGHRAAAVTEYVDGGVVESPVEAQHKMEGGMHFNTPIWQATGVINDLPKRAEGQAQERPLRSASVGRMTGQAQRMQEMRRDDSMGKRIERPEYTSGADDIWRLQESAEVGKAAEMALREVLGSLEAARKKVEPGRVWEDFDFYALSFPSLCLAILPPPPTLFSTTPFAAAHTWTLSPPGEMQREALKRMLNERCQYIRDGDPAKLPDSAVFRYHVHLDNSWDHWSSLPEAEKATAWNLELSRAFVQEQEQKKQLRKDWEAAQQRILHLEAEYQRLSQCQLPREYLIKPPSTIPVSQQIVREMRSSKTEAADANYDVDQLLEKWKASVKSMARPVRSTSTANGVGEHQPPLLYEMTRSVLRGDMILTGSGLLNIGGPMPRSDQGHGEWLKARKTAKEYAVEEDDRDEMNGEVGADHEDDDGSVEEVDGELGHSAVVRFREFDEGNGVVNRNGKRPLDAEEVQEVRDGGGGRRMRIGSF